MKHSAQGAPSFALNNLNDPPYRLVRSARRTLAIHILPDASIEVRAPLYCPVKTISDFLLQKSEWIQNQQQAMREKAMLPNRALQPGDALPVRGQPLPLQVSMQAPAINRSSIALPAVLFEEPNQSRCSEVLIQLYKQLTLPLVRERVSVYAPLLKVTPTAVKISAATGRWGSCSGKNSLNFSWMLGAVPPEVLDYVVVHELCHIRHHNHSEAFWQLVESVLPDYRQRQALLRVTQEQLCPLRQKG